ncbi:MAG TPA: heme NO-binding domain-containing protein [Candidatus Binatia bacterium]|nr:heme NO-binding domain-containing protein [Candidatus Binatia bacterium]
MRGILFTGFVEFMEQELPAAAGTVGIGAYSPLGSYPAEELLGLVARAGEVAGLPAPEVLRRFGAHLFRTLATLYPVFVDGVGSSLELLGGIETHVHGEVKKLYPDTEFPRFEIRARRPGRLELVYRSRRPLADLAEGMMRGCIAWFGDCVDLDRQDIDAADGRAARFTLRASA